MRFLISDINFGIVPFSKFEPRSRWDSAGIDDNEFGTGPDKEFDDKDRFFRVIKLPIVKGIVPIRLFVERFKLSRFSRRVSDVGIFPVSLLADRSMRVRFG